MITPDDIINKADDTKIKKPSNETKVEASSTDEDVFETDNSSAKKSARKKKSFFDKLDFSSLVSSETLMNNLSFILFIALLALVYIWNSHYALRSMNYLDKNEKQLKQLKWQYIYSKSDLEFKSKQSEVAKNVEVSGIKELKNPPTKIYINENGSN
jgi:hypothetical protein